MALVHLDTMTDQAAWTITQSPGGVSSVAGRVGNATRLSYMSPWTILQYNLPPASESAVISVGMAVKPLASLAAGSSQIMMTLKSDAAATEHVHVCYNASKWLVKRAPSTNISGPSTVSVVPDAWSFIEVTCTLGDSTAGTVLMKQNGVTVLNTTGIDTKNAGTKTVFDSLWLWLPAAGSGMTLDIADVWVATGADPGLGNCQTWEVFPTGDGVFPGGANQWVGSDSDSLSNYLLVNETGTPVTASYVHSATSGARDVYTLADPSISGQTVQAVGVTGHMATTGTAGYGSAVTVYQAEVPPTTNTNSDFNLGAQFQSGVAGRITGIRFYRNSASVLTSRALKLWTDAGALIQSVNTSGESGTGWHSVSITPYSVAAGTIVRASYYVGTNDIYSRTPDPGSGIPPVVSGFLTRKAPTYSVTGVNNFPNTVSQADFWVDIIFEPESPVNLVLADAAGTNSLTVPRYGTATAKSHSGVFTTAADGTTWTTAKANAMQVGVANSSTTDVLLYRLKAVVAAASVVDLGTQVTSQVGVAGNLTAGFPLRAGWDVGWD